MLGDMNGARALYDEYSSKLYSPACKKCIIEEFAYVCYVNDLVVDSMTYIQKAENIQSDEVPQIIKIRVYLIKSYLKARTDYEEAKKEASKMLPYLYNADIDKPTKAKYFGEIAIAYWNIGDIHSAINFINLSLSYSLKSYEQYPEEEDTKFIIRKIGMCMSQWAHKKKNGKYEEKMAIPKPGLFTEHYEKGLISDFSDKMVICIVAEMYVASSKILSSKEALEWAKIMVDKMQKFPTELNSFVLTVPYLFISSGDYDRVETLLEIYENANTEIQGKKPAPADKEQVFFYLYLFPLLMAYDAEMMLEGNSDLFVNYIRPLIFNHEGIFVDKVKYAELKAITSKRDIPSLTGMECPELRTFKKLLIIPQAYASIAFMHTIDVLSDVSRYSEVGLYCFDSVLNNFSFVTLKNKLDKFKSDFDYKLTSEKGIPFIESSDKKERYKRVIKVFYNGLKHQPKLGDGYLTWMGY